MRSRSAAGIRMTKVGLWFVLLTLLVGVAATNTGNNALYMVLAVMLATLVVSGVVSRNNLRRLSLAVEPPEEMFANAPFPVHYRLENRGRLVPRFFLLLSLGEEAEPVVVPRVRTSERIEGDAEMLIGRRGRHRFSDVVIWSLFPLGLFRKGFRRRSTAEALVYPEIFSAATCHLEQPHRLGEESRPQPGWGHDLHALRSFRSGDDPRGIHWKQTARTGTVIFKERQAEESRRLSILLDNAVGSLDDVAEASRFERLVSEAATAAVDYLEHGYEVELVTRDAKVPFSSGASQRRAILETLALLETQPVARRPLESSSSDVPELRLALDRHHATATGVPA